MMEEKGGCTVINITIVPTEGSSGGARGAGPLAVAVTLLGAKVDSAAVGIHASALKAILFDALATFLDTAPPPPADSSTEAVGAAADGHTAGAVPVVLALEATALDPDGGVASSTVIPLVNSSAARDGVRWILDRGRDFWVVECGRGAYILDNERLPLQTNRPAHDVNLVPQHKMPPPPFIVSSSGIRKSTDGFGKPFVAFKFQVRHTDLEWAIAKRFSAFAALHEQLRLAKGDDPQRLAAGGSLPALPSSWPKPSSEEAIDDRRLKLEQYLQAIVAIPGAMENPHVLGFLGIMNPRTDLPLDDPLQPGRKRQVVHMTVLPTTLQWGDIVMFRCAHIVAGLQRVMTRAEWDHVALVVSGANGGLDLLESTGEGVTKYPLMARVKAYGTTGFSEAIALRRLEGPRTPSVHEAQRKFVEEVVGKPYGFLSLSNLFPAKRTSQERRPSLTLLDRVLRRGRGPPEEGQEQQRQEDAFFCSQLVAAGLKAMGVLPADLNSGRFWPGSFAPAGGIDEDGVMAPGWRFGELCLVDTKTLELGSAVLTTTTTTTTTG